MFTFTCHLGKKHTNPRRHTVEGADKHTMATHKLAGAGVPRYVQL